MLEQIAASFLKAAPAVEHWSLRIVDERLEGLSVRQNVLEPVRNWRNLGAMITVADRGGIGYGATCDLTAGGLARAAALATDWAHQTADIGLLRPGDYPRISHRGDYRNDGEVAWNAWSLPQKVALLHDACRRLKIGERVVDWQSALVHRRIDSLLLTGAGGRIAQSFSFIDSALVAVANDGPETQLRSHGGDLYRQGGLEQLSRTGFPDEAERVAGEALPLLDAPDCPSGRMDVLLMPGQMVLQVHESIGHPLELDRILGDERNYAGTSFVTLDMFGSYRYGSELLNVTFDPGRPEQAATYRFDDDGAPAERQYIIRKGILQRPLGGAASQARSGLAGVANARASGWNRPPIDRMANVNLESGEKSLEALIGSIERGVWMDTNKSWSIDDSRNKFQFGCEIGRVIENGELKGLVKNPGYRGISGTFWRSLASVGDESTFRVLGLVGCGKGEPNQMVHAGHAAPACLFTDVDVFGAG